MDMDMSQYMGMYIDGANENLQEMNRLLLDLENNPKNIEILAGIFRAAHTLKGMSATMGFQKVAHLTHEMENLMDLCRREVLGVSGEITEILFQTFDVLERLVKDTIEGEVTVTDDDLHRIMGRLQSVAEGGAEPPPSTPPPVNLSPPAPTPPPSPTPAPPRPTPTPVVAAPPPPAPPKPNPSPTPATKPAPTVAVVHRKHEKVVDTFNRQEMEQYMGMYVDGANENLEEMNRLLLRLEKNQNDIEIFNEIFRAAHTLKGMSATMGFARIAHVTHEMESLMDKCRTRALTVNQAIFDAIFESFDVLDKLVKESISGEVTEIDFYTVVDKMFVLQQTGGVLPEGGGTAPAATPPSAESAPPPTAAPPIDIKGIKFNEYERQVALQALRQNFHVFMVKIKLVSDCLLKAARVFMIVRALEEIESEILKTEPPSQELEEEKFESEFSIFLVNKNGGQVVSDAINKVSEIELVTVTSLDEFLLGHDQGSGAPAPKAVAASPAASTATPLPASATPPKPLSPVGGKPAEEKKIPAPPGGAPVVDPTKKGGEAKKAIPTTIRVDMRRLEELMNLVGELVTNKTRLTEVGQRYKLKELNEVMERVNQITASLQDVVLKVRMVPIDTVFDRFPRLVRDLSKKLNKKINLVIEGKDTEMDRTVIDEIGDPMVHLIRNALDHGIEDPETRVNNGKKEDGTIVLNAHHEGNSVVIEVRDDGKGINPDIVGKLAVKRGVVTEEELAKMTVPEIQKIIFAAGFSTADVVSDLSGRGVGMDAVKSKIEELNGVLLLDSKVNVGTTVRVKLPMTLAILQALMINLQAETYAIPLSMVLETVDIYKEDINIVQHQEVYVLRGEVIPLVRLNKILEVPMAKVPEKEPASAGGEKNFAAEDEISIVVCSTGDRKAGFIVDNLIGQQEIVIKSLGQILQGSGGIMGATIKGDGSVALILDIPSLMEAG